jgi:hypothetical protein
MGFYGRVIYTALLLDLAISGCKEIHKEPTKPQDFQVTNEAPVPDSNKPTVPEPNLAIIRPGYSFPVPPEIQSMPMSELAAEVYNLSIRKFRQNGVITPGVVYIGRTEMADAMYLTVIPLEEDGQNTIDMTLYSGLDLVVESQLNQILSMPNPDYIEAMNILKNANFNKTRIHDVGLDGINLSNKEDSVTIKDNKGTKVFSSKKIIEGLVEVNTTERGCLEKYLSVLKE